MQIHSTQFFTQYFPYNNSKYNLIENFPRVSCLKVTRNSTQFFTQYFPYNNSKYSLIENFPGVSCLKVTGNNEFIHLIIYMSIN